MRVQFSLYIDVMSSLGLEMTSMKLLGYIDISTNIFGTVEYLRIIHILRKPIILQQWNLWRSKI